MPLNQTQVLNSLDSISSMDCVKASVPLINVQLKDREHNNI